MEFLLNGKWCKYTKNDFKELKNIEIFHVRDFSVDKNIYKCTIVDDTFYTIDEDSNILHKAHKSTVNKGHSRKLLTGKRELVSLTYKPIDNVKEETDEYVSDIYRKKLNDYVNKDGKEKALSRWAMIGEKYGIPSGVNRNAWLSKHGLCKKVLDYLKTIF